MKNLCYNISTKRKNGTKNGSNVQKSTRRGIRANEQVRVLARADKVPQGYGERKKERRVQKAMIPSHDEAEA